MTCGSRWTRLALAAALSAGAAGCQTSLMPTPNIYADGKYQLFDPAIRPELCTTTADILYITDRAPEPKKDGTMRYGYHRSPSLAFGSCVVEIDGGTGWQELASWDSSVPNLPDWTHEMFDLGPWAGKTVRIRFRFDSVDDLFNAYAGWSVDDVTVTDVLAP